MIDRLDPKLVADRAQRSAIERKRQRGEPLLPEEEAFLDRDSRSPQSTPPAREEAKPRTKEAEQRLKTSP